jgi:hypothetical protein
MKTRITLLLLLLALSGCSTMEVAGTLQGAFPVQPVYVPAYQPPPQPYYATPLPKQCTSTTMGGVTQTQCY